MDAHCGNKSRKDPAADYTLRETLRTWQWWALWLLLFSEYVRGYFGNFPGSSSISELAGVSCP